MADWGLQAIVRGSCSGETDTSVYNIMGSDEHSCFAAPISFSGDDFSHIFPDYFGNNTTFGDLECLSEPFRPPVLHPFPPPIMATSSISLPRDQVKDDQENIQQKNQNTSATKCKTSKKNQQTRVVKEVSADGISSDAWAWRKYGQKPIKGSPYPRSYYRCSSSKGCSARKQVERSYSDPSIFTITYTSDHNHAHPTRRNSLAGSTRNKFPKMKNTENNSNSPTFNKENMLSPASASASMTSNEEEVEHIIRIKKEEEQVLEEGESAEVLLPGFFSNDDLFPSLEELLFG